MCQLQLIQGTGCLGIRGEAYDRKVASVSHHPGWDTLQCFWLCNVQEIAALPLCPFDARLNARSWIQMQMEKHDAEPGASLCTSSGSRRRKGAHSYKNTPPHHPRDPERVSRVSRWIEQHLTILSPNIQIFLGLHSFCWINFLLLITHKNGMN